MFGSSELRQNMHSKPHIVVTMGAGISTPDLNAEHEYMNSTAWTSPAFSSCQGIITTTESLSFL